MTLELRIYIWIFLLLCLVLVLAVLRLYNAIVKNSGFIIRLNAELKSLEATIKSLIKDNGSHRQVLRNSMTNLSQKIESLKDKFNGKPFKDS